MAETIPKQDNPAGRLYSVLVKSGQITGGNIMEGFHRMLGVEQQEDVFRQIGFLVASLRDIEQKLREAGEGDFADIYAESMPRLRQMLIGTLDYRQPWENFKRENILEKDLTALQYCSSVLSKNAAEQVLSENEVEDFKRRVNELYNDANNSDLEKELKIEILESLEAINRAIHDYNIKGIKDVKIAVTNGAVLALATRKIDKTNEILVRYRELIGYGLQLIKFSLRAYPFLKSAAHLLLPPGSPPPPDPPLPPEGI